mmetsp:Transcript_527/g.1469  ORF Transcript_527/g.1469 Transcript_527/m.1469 type:complete len:341 (-) Transcript_527:115-1137(-)
MKYHYIIITQKHLSILYSNTIYNFELHGSLGLQCTILHHRLGNHHSIQRRTPQQLIPTNKEFQCIIESDIFTNTSHLDIVLPCGREWHGIFEFFGIIDEFDSRCLLECLAGRRDVDGFVEEGDDVFGVGAGCRDAYGCAANREIILQSTNLTCLPRNLHLFLGISILLEFVNVWNDIERQRMRKDLVLGHIAFAVEDGFGSIDQFVHSWLSGTGGCLVCRHDHLLQSKQLMQRPNRHKTNGGSTIRIGNQLLSLGNLGINFRHHQRNALLVSKRRRIINDHGAIVTLANILGVGQGEVTIDGKEYDVTFPCGTFGEEFDGDRAELGGDLFTGGTLGTEDA